jgi:hypothetical protein
LANLADETPGTGVTVKTEEVIQKRRRFLERWDVNFSTLAAKIIVDPP